MTRAPHPALRGFYRAGAAPRHMIDQLQRIDQQLDVIMRDLATGQLFSDRAWRTLVTEIGVAQVIERALQREPEPVRSSSDLPARVRSALQPPRERAARLNSKVRLQDAPRATLRPVDAARVQEILQNHLWSGNSATADESRRAKRAMLQQPAAPGATTHATGQQPPAHMVIGFMRGQRRELSISAPSASNRWQARASGVVLSAAWQTPVRTELEPAEVSALLESLHQAEPGAAPARALESAGSAAAPRTIERFNVPASRARTRARAPGNNVPTLHVSFAASNPPAAGSANTSTSPEPATGLRGLAARFRETLQPAGEGDVPSLPAAAPGEASVVQERLRESELAVRLERLLRREARQQGIDVDGVAP